jgi:hypothetical protein
MEFDDLLLPAAGWNWNISILLLVANDQFTAQNVPMPMNV